MASARGANAGMSLIKRGWNEIPEIVCCVAMMAVGAVGLVVGTYRYSQNKEERHQYRYLYEVVRTSDVDPNKDIYN